jgi:hypothetical protein
MANVFVPSEICIVTGFPLFVAALYTNTFPRDKELSLDNDDAKVEYSDAVTWCKFVFALIPEIICD